jgi:obg-like ATPase 1
LIDHQFLSDTHGAPQAAGTIHTDFERGFICAEVMHYEELHELGNEHAVKAAGKYRQEGKNYTVADGDIIFFVSGRCSSSLEQQCAVHARQTAREW